MQIRKLICLLLLLLPGIIASAQKTLSYDEVNNKSYELYQKANWKELIHYGKEAIAEGQDFLLLRLRLGYASFILNNFSEALKHYAKVIKLDRYNETAHYYSWLCLKYLNQNELAGTHIKYFSKDMRAKEKLHSIAFTSIGTESSYKVTDLTTRGNSFYARLDLQNRWNWNIYMDQSGTIFNQTINERTLFSVVNNRNIAINQKEYYNRLTINLSPRLQLKTVYHYIYTPFNNLTYRNHAGMAGIRYHRNYFNVQADAIIARVTDSTQQQYNLQVSLYPFGNLNLYSFSTAMYRSRQNNSGFNFKQVIGVKLLRNIWLEGNATLGSFTNLFENDAMYLYNAIDKNKIKAGATIYLSIGSKLIAQAGYTFEQREIYKTINTFNQHSITGGLSWKF